MTDTRQDINQKTARREFCGPHKKISAGVMEQLDKDIENAKRNNDKVLKKKLKRKYVEHLSNLYKPS
jgi:hypothetical protein